MAAHDTAQPGRLVKAVREAAECLEAVECQLHIAEGNSDPAAVAALQSAVQDARLQHAVAKTEMLLMDESAAAAEVSLPVLVISL